MKAKITAVAHFTPEQTMTSAELEDILRTKNPTVRISKGIIESATGISSRHFAQADEYNSHMAASAALKLFSKANVLPAEIDLLIFAAAGQDLLEPATGHIVQHMLKTRCPIFDVKNACNSFINALEIAEAFIVSGRYKKILIATGETPSKAIKWELKDREDFKKSFAGYTLGDAGAAVLVEPSEDESGIIAYSGTTQSSQWETGTLPGGGSRHPRGDEYSYFQGDGAALKEAFEKIGPEFLQSFLVRMDITSTQINRIFIHQVSIPYLDSFIDVLGLDKNKIQRTVATYGNIAAATLPLNMSIAEDQGSLNKGDTILLIGLAGGISLEVMLMRF